LSESTPEVLTDAGVTFTGTPTAAQISRQTVLVGKRAEMLAAAEKELAKVTYKVERRTQILEAHQLALAGMTAKAEAAAAAVADEDEEVDEDQ
jgi:hypothetical protein